jgi:hypothetical protein
MGCAPEFERVSEIETLRILAVQKDKPYARPGDGDPTTTDDAVKLSMLWRDDPPPEKAGAPVQLQWFTGCFNPPGDLFFSCFRAAAAIHPGAGRDLPGSGGAGVQQRSAARDPPHDSGSAAVLGSDAAALRPGLRVFRAMRGRAQIRRAARRA